MTAARLNLRVVVSPCASRSIDKRTESAIGRMIGELICSRCSGGSIGTAHEAPRAEKYALASSHPMRYPRAESAMTPEAICGSRRPSAAAAARGDVSVFDSVNPRLLLPWVSLYLSLD